MKIFKADVFDLARMEHAAKSFHLQSRFMKHFEIQRFIELWRDLLEKQDAVIYALEVEGTIRGAIGGVIYPEPYNGEMAATEMFWYVEEKYRGNGLKLYHAFEKWARDKGAKSIRMVHLMDSMPGRLATVYQRLGYEPVEVTYTKEL